MGIHTSLETLMKGERRDPVMEIEQAVANRALILRLSGELDLKTAPSFKETVLQALGAARLHDLVVNLSAVTFVDSSGIGVLLGSYKELQRGGGQVVLVAPQPHVRTVLELAGLARLMPFVTTEAEALELVAAGRRQANA